MSKASPLHMKQVLIYINNEGICGRTVNNNLYNFKRSLKQAGHFSNGIFVAMPFKTSKQLRFDFSIRAFFRKGFLIGYHRLFSCFSLVTFSCVKNWILSGRVTFFTCESVYFENQALRKEIIVR